MHLFRNWNIHGKFADAECDVWLIPKYIASVPMFDNEFSKQNCTTNRDIFMELKSEAKTNDMKAVTDLMHKEERSVILTNIAGIGKTS